MCLRVDMARVRPASLKLCSLDTDKIEFLSVRSRVQYDHRHTAWTQSSTQEQNHRKILNITVVEMENETNKMPKKSYKLNKIWNHEQKHKQLHGVYILVTL